MGIISSVLTCGTCYCSDKSCRICCCTCPSTVEFGQKNTNDYFKFYFMEYNDVGFKWRIYRSCRLPKSQSVYDKLIGSYSVIPYNSQFEYIVHDLEKNIHTAYAKVNTQFSKLQPIFTFKVSHGVLVFEKYYKQAGDYTEGFNGVETLLTPNSCLQCMDC